MALGNMPIIGLVAAAALAIAGGAVGERILHKREGERKYAEVTLAYTHASNDARSQYAADKAALDAHLAAELKQAQFTRDEAVKQLRVDYPEVVK